MKLIRNLDQLPDELRGGAVSIGNFDGVHRGHARIVERLIKKARNAGGPAIVFTFDPHPVRLLRPELAPPPLTWTDRKAELLAQLGVDSIVAYPTDESLLRLSAEEFFTTIICQQLGARAMVEGPNFYFGRDRSGTVQRLREFCAEAGIELEIVEPLRVEDEYVSSSRVRDAIRAGNVDLASQLLTRPYRIRGMVTHGSSRGARLGFPTANVDAIDTLVPRLGVYAGEAISQQGRWPAAIHIGPNPTFGEKEVKVEVHLIGYEGSLYGSPLEVDFFTQLRDIHAFDSVDQLKTQLRLDIQSASQVVAERVEPNKEAGNEC